LVTDFKIYVKIMLFENLMSEVGKCNLVGNAKHDLGQRRKLRCYIEVYLQSEV